MCGLHGARSLGITTSRIKDGAYYCCCAYVLRISRYSVSYGWFLLIQQYFCTVNVAVPITIKLTRDLNRQIITNVMFGVKGEHRSAIGVTDDSHSVTIKPYLSPQRY